MKRGARLLLLLLLVTVASGIGVPGYFISTPNCSVIVYRRPTGGIDTLKTKTGNAGGYMILTEDFFPPLRLGDTLTVAGGWNLGGMARTLYVLRFAEREFLDLHLNRFTTCVTNVSDSSHIGTQLKCTYQLLGHSVKAETVDVDTSFYGNFHFDIHLPLPRDSVHDSDSLYLRCYKVFGASNESLAYTDRVFVLSRARYDAQLAADSIPFPEHRVLGVSELPNERPRVRHLKVRPTIVSQGVRIGGKGVVEIYDALGQRVAERKINDGILNLRGFPGGIYYLKLKGSRTFVEKIVKTM